MSLVATLVSDPQRAALSQSLADKAARAVEATAITWLAGSIACDLMLPAKSDAEFAETILRDVVAGEPIDVAVQDEAGRRKKLLIADMDSTMIGQECIDELADEAGFGARVADITAWAMRGEIEFEPALRERVALLRDLPVDVIERVIASRIQLAPGGLELVRTMRANGAYTALVSGGFTDFTGPISAMLGFDEHRANRLHRKNGALTGTVADPILGRGAKLDALEELAARRGLGPDDAMAVGDGANDLDMIRRAGSGVALHAKPDVAEQARFRIDHGDLTALLYLQGYSREAFAA